MTDQGGISYLEQLEENVFWRSTACRDKGMGLPEYQWSDIADHLWDFYNKHRESWPGQNQIPPSKETFYEWVRTAIQEFDGGDWNKKKWVLKARKEQYHDI